MYTRSSIGKKKSEFEASQNPKRAPIFVEFMGLPGSGKTTLSHHSAKLLRITGKSVLEPTYFINSEMRTVPKYLLKLWHTTKIVLLRPSWAYNWFSLILQSRQRTLKDTALMIINCFYILEIYRFYSQHNNICFLDQGILQAFLSLDYSSKKKNFFESRLAIPMDFLATRRVRIILTKTGADTVVERLTKRNQNVSRLERMKKKNDFVEIVRVEKRKIEHLTRFLSTYLQGDHKMVEIKSDGSIHSAAQHITKLFVCNQGKNRYELVSL